MVDTKFSLFTSLPISVIRVVETEANKFYDSYHSSYNAALLTRCYTQHALHPLIDSETTHKRHFINVLFINKGMSLLTYKVSLRIGPSLHPYLLIFKILNRQ